MNKLTPREPTPEMADAGWNAFKPHNPNMYAIWRAMHDAAPSGWQPIETAPKDGYFLAANKHDVWVAHWRSVMLNHWHIEPKSAQYEKPTHWMPLPAPPSEQTQAAPSVPSVEQELLEALEALLEHEGERSVNGIGLEDDSEALMQAKANARAAIARARGE